MSSPEHDPFSAFLAWKKAHAQLMAAERRWMAATVSFFQDAGPSCDDLYVDVRRLGAQEKELLASVLASSQPQRRRVAG